MTPLAVIRPQPGCDATVSAAHALGLDAHGIPLFAVAPLAWDAPDPEAFDALLIGSANALLHGGAALGEYRNKPVYAVGETTARQAREMGFTVAAAGTGGLQDLAGRILPEHRRLLRLSGRNRVEIVLPAAVEATERIVYASDPLPMPPELTELLENGAVAALHSAEAAHHFAQQCDARNIARERIAIVALAPRIGAAAGQGWAAVGIARQPRDQALLALAKQMCQTGLEMRG